LILHCSNKTQQERKREEGEIPKAEDGRLLIEDEEIQPKSKLDKKQKDRNLWT
jgi:hypothetical protein